MLEISPAKVVQVIFQSREGDRADEELEAFIDAMNEDEKTSLVALAWVGRGAFDAAEFDEARAIAAAEATTPTARYLMGSAASFYAAQLEQWLTTQHEWSPEWIEAAEMSDLKLRLTAEELKEMNAEILGVVERHAAASSQPARSAAADAAAVDCLVIINSFPNPRPVL